jgi:hypothetical protein
MKMMMSMCVVLTITVAAWCYASQQQSGGQSQNSAQSSSGGQNSQNGQSSANQKSKSDQSMVGKVSSDGKTFTDANNSKDYKVDNPDSLQSSEGQNVAVLVHVDPDTGTIHVIQLEPTQEMSGKVSGDDKTFVSDKDSKSYTVDNPDALKGHEGQHVALVFLIDPDTGDILVTQVEMPQQ